MAPARIEITSGDRARPIQFCSGDPGRFISANLRAEKYSLQQTRDGFGPRRSSVDRENPVELELTLAIATAGERLGPRQKPRLGQFRPWSRFRFPPPWTQPRGCFSG